MIGEITFEEVIEDDITLELVLEQFPVVTGADPTDISINAALFLEDQEGAVGINVHDQNGNDVGAENLSGDWEVPIYDTSSPMKTGQNVSYASGDDGDRQDGRLVNFTTLAYNNPFGNTNRFTDELGGQTYTNNIVIDWASESQSSRNVLGWCRAAQSGNWTAAITGAASTSIGAFTTGWRLPNIREVFGLLDWGASSHVLETALGYTDSSSGGRIITSTSAPLATTFTLEYFNSGAIGGVAKTSTRSYFPVRTFTLTELGL